MEPIRVTWNELKALQPCRLRRRRKLFTLKQRWLGRGLTASEAFELGVSAIDIAWVVESLNLTFDVTKINVKGFYHDLGVESLAYLYPEETKEAIIAQFG